MNTNLNFNKLALTENFILGYFYISIVDIFKSDLLRTGFLSGDRRLEVHGERGGPNVTVHISYRHRLWYDWNTSAGPLYPRKHRSGRTDRKNHGQIQSQPRRQHCP